MPPHPSFLATSLALLATLGSLAIDVNAPVKKGPGVELPTDPGSLVDTTTVTWVDLRTENFMNVSGRDRQWWKKNTGETTSKLSNSSVGQSATLGMYSTSETGNIPQDVGHPTAPAHWLQFRFPLDGKTNNGTADFDIGHFRMLFTNKAATEDKMRIGLSRGLLDFNSDSFNTSNPLANLGIWLEFPGTSQVLPPTIHFSTGPNWLFCSGSDYDSETLLTVNTIPTGDYYLAVFNVKQIYNTSTIFSVPNRLHVDVYVYRAADPELLITQPNVDELPQARLLYKTQNPVVLGFWKHCSAFGNSYRLTPMLSFSKGDANQGHFLLGFQRKYITLFDASFRP